jgi:hypothetical protein
MVDAASASTAEGQSEAGTLPYEEPLRMWASRGTGARCSFCRMPIEAHDIEYEVEMAPPGNPVGLHFHLNCYRAWETQA